MVAFLQRLPALLRYHRFHLRPAVGQKVRLWVMDESRFGLRTLLRRRLTLRGIKPVARVHHPRAALWLYGAVDALSGTSYFRLAARCNAATFQQFLEELVQEFPDERHLLLLDNSATHAARTLILPPTVRLLFLPPYSPELNPIERVWQHLKAALSGQLFDCYQHLSDTLESRILALTDQLLHALVAPPWLSHAARAARLSLVSP